MRNITKLDKKEIMKVFKKYYHARTYEDIAEAYLDELYLLQYPVEDIVQVALEYNGKNLIHIMDEIESLENLIFFCNNGIFPDEII